MIGGGDYDQIIKIVYPCDDFILVIWWCMLTVENKVYLTCARFADFLIGIWV